jgi:hypothetical protein
MIHRVAQLLAQCDAPSTVLPPTVLYNEGWLLRLVLDWFAAHPGVRHEFSLLPRARWFSEALLASPFLARWRGDPLAEAYTHADGIIGHFAIRPAESGEATLLLDAQQLVVVEAKLGSALSPGVSNAGHYDQAARTVACMAWMLAAASVSPTDLERLAFYVVAPRSQIETNVFSDLVTKASIRAKVELRVAQYAGRRDEWFCQAFEPLLERVDLDVLSWESILACIERLEPETDLAAFYQRCLHFNLHQ